MIIQIEVDERLYEKAMRVLNERQSDFDYFVHLQMKTLVRNEKFYDLRDRFGFGKYRDEFVGDVIRGEPDYVVWCLKHLAGFGLTPDALQLLSEMGVDFD